MFYSVHAVNITVCCMTRRGGPDLYRKSTPSVESFKAAQAPAVGVHLSYFVQYVVCKLES